MKRIQSTLLVLLSFSMSATYAQESSNASGGEAAGTGGTVSYTIGQIDYITSSSQDGSVNQGVQQPYEFFTVGLSDLEGVELSAFPNPTTGVFKLKIMNGIEEEVSFSLSDNSGRILEKGAITGKEKSLDLSNYTPGIYMLNVVLDSESMKTLKIIKN